MLKKLEDEVVITYNQFKKDINSIYLKVFEKLGERVNQIKFEEEFKVLTKDEKKITVSSILLDRENKTLAIYSKDTDEYTFLNEKLTTDSQFELARKMCNLKEA